MKTLIKPKKKKVVMESLRQMLGDLVACDTETTGLNSWKGDRAFAFSFANPEGKTHYIQFPVDPFTREVRYASNPSAYKQLKEFFADRAVEKVFWNAKFDVRMCEAADLKVHGKIHEGMFAAHVCYSDELTFGLKAMAKKYCGIGDEDQEELKSIVEKLRRKAKAKKWNIAKKMEADYWLPVEAWRCCLVSPEEGHRIAKACETYAVTDAVRTIVLWMFHSQLMKKLKVQHVYEQEMTLWPVVYGMEERGIRVSPQETTRLRVAYEKDQKVAKQAMTKMVGEFNPRSPQQVQKILYDRLKLQLSPTGYRKKKTERCTDVDALMELSAQHPLCDWILRYRAASKAISFCDQYDSMRAKTDERGVWVIHASFRQCGPKTGRFSCAEPNMQQIPSMSAGRTPHPIDGRSPFGPRAGCVWFPIDYSQVEVRIYADQSQEPTLLEIINSGQHVHTAITDHVWGGQTDTAIETAVDCLFSPKGTANDYKEIQEARKKFGKKTPELTAEAWLKHYDWSIVKAEASLGKKNTMNKTKLMIFNQIYGGGVPSLMHLMRKPRSEVLAFVRYFDERIPGMRPWNAEVTSQARKDGYVLTAFGRRVPVEADRAYAAVNYRIQGSAADLMKYALIETNKYLYENNVHAWIVMTIHDEIVFEFDRREDKMLHVLKIKHIMENAGGVFKIPMVAEVSRVKEKWSEKSKVPWAS